MPKLKFSLPGDERYNTLMSIVALLQRVGEMHISELADHFDVSKESMRGMLSTLNTTSFMPRNAAEQLPFFIDLDRVDDEDGIVCLEFDDEPQGVPQITSSQSVALLSGLRYLQQIPDFEESSEVEELIRLLSAAQPAVENIKIEPSKFDSDMATIKKAILLNRRIECVYVNSKGEHTERKIDPLLLITSEGNWYLRGYCLKNNEVRTFRLDHMVNAVLCDDSRSFEALEAAQNLDETAPIYCPTETDTEVVLELAPEAYQLAGMFVTLKEPTRVGEENIRVAIKMGYLPDIGPLVSRYGVHAKVISPESAREIVRKYAQLALDNRDSWSEAE
jgi:proteasome accessory factor C